MYQYSEKITFQFKHRTGIRVTVTDKEILLRFQTYGLYNSISFHCHITLQAVSYPPPLKYCLRRGNTVLHFHYLSACSKEVPWS